MSAGLRNTCLNQLKTLLPDILALAEAPEHYSLAALSAALRGRTPAGPLQDGADIIALARKKAASIFSPKAGDLLARTLEENFCALTANHLGTDFHPEFLQGDLVFALEAIRTQAPAIPVLACGSVTADSFGYPRGFFMARGREQSVLPGRIPVFPNKQRKTPLSLHGPFGADAPRALLAQPNLRSPDAGPLHPAEKAAAHRILHELFLHPRVLAGHSFGEQVGLMNSLLWERLFAPDAQPVPPLYTLDLTLLSLDLALTDLERPHSLLCALLSPGLPEALLEELDGVRGCWQRQEDGNRENPLQRGSFLFWGLDADKRLYPLYPDANFSRLGDIDLTPKALKNALRQGCLLPGLFISFAITALARGLFCCGGAYQGTYLKNMRDGLVRALTRRGEHSLAQTLGRSLCGGISTGFMPLRLDRRAAAALDILAVGGLKENTMADLAALPVRLALEAALSHLYGDAIPPPQRLPGWLEALDSPAGVPLT